MRLLKPLDLLHLDHQVQSDFKDINLIQEAVERSSHWISRNFSNRLSVVVLCGKGNNGKDGLGIAKALRDYHGFAYVQCFEFNQLDKYLNETKNYDITIDALLGISFKPPLSGTITSVVAKINKSNAKKIAIDLPTGLDALNGTGELIAKADHTLTMGYLKPGFFLNQGPMVCGKLHRIGLSYPPSLVEKITPRVLLLSKKFVSKHLPCRPYDGNKSDGGRAVIVAGNAKFPGAAVLSAQSASRAGSGYVELLTYPENFEILKNPDFILGNRNKIELSNLKNQAVLLGPGSGIDKNTSQWLDHLLRHHFNKVVLDADCLSVLAQKPRALNPAWVITPHSGELGKLIGWPASKVEAERFQALENCHKKYRCSILLKGFHTLYFNGKDFVVVPTGNRALAKAGTGDVLAGMIVAFLALGLSADLASIMASYIHGWLADQWIKRYDHLSLKASDLVRALPQALKYYRKDQT